MPDLPDHAAASARPSGSSTRPRTGSCSAGWCSRSERAWASPSTPSTATGSTSCSIAPTPRVCGQGGRTGFALYTDEQEHGSRRRLALAGELRRAIAEDEIVFHFQPKALIAAGQVTVWRRSRWKHPVEGMISPSEFIPIAEETNLLHALTERILDRARAAA